MTNFQIRLLHRGYWRVWWSHIWLVAMLMRYNICCSQKLEQLLLLILLRPLSAKAPTEIIRYIEYIIFCLK